MKRPPLEILVATTNQNKFSELIREFETLPFRFLSLRDLQQTIPEPEETENTLLGNALLKAEYYAKKSGYLTIADDSGFFIDALDGWPGIHAARFKPTPEERQAEVLTRLQGSKNRQAALRAMLALYDPKRDEYFAASGEDIGTILEEPSTKEITKFWIDPIFESHSAGRPFSSLSLEEKNTISHRGRALAKMKYYLQTVYGGKHIVVPLALVIHEKQILMTKRNDPINTWAHGKWEFPGGGVEMGESMHDAVIREAKEETGYDVEIVTLLQHVETEEVFLDEKQVHYQVYLLPYVCRIVGGAPSFRDAEVLEAQWVEPDQVTNYELLGKNDMMYNKLLPELTKAIQQYF